MITPRKVSTKNTRNRIGYTSRQQRPQRPTEYRIRPKRKQPCGSGIEDAFRSLILQILLPYVIGLLFGIGYGSVVAAGGWEALREPPTADDIPDSLDGREGGGIPGGGGSRGVGGKTDVSFAAQICAVDSRAEEEARANADGNEDSSGSGSDNDDSPDPEDDPVGGVGNAAVGAPLEGGAAGGIPTTRGPARVTRSRVRAAGFKEAAGGRGGGSSSSSGSEGGSRNAAGSDGVRDTVGEGSGSLHGARLPAEAADTGGGSRGASGGGGGGGSSGEALRRLSLVDHTARYGDTDPDDEDDDEEDGAGWGQQVVVKPVKVALWDKRGQQLPKERLSLNKLRARIIARAESTPQKATYRRAARLVRLAVCCLGFVYCFRKTFCFW